MADDYKWGGIFGGLIGGLFGLAGASLAASESRRQYNAQVQREKQSKIAEVQALTADSISAARSQTLAGGVREGTYKKSLSSRGAERIRRIEEEYRNAELPPRSGFLGLF